MLLNKKAKNQKTTEQALKELYDNLQKVDASLKQSELIEKKIQLQIDNCEDDKIKVSRAINNAKAQGAYSDASILEGKLSDINSSKSSFSIDLQQISDHNNELRRIHDELVRNIEAIRNMRDDVNRTYEQARMQNISNISYSQSQAINDAYDSMKADANNELFKAISLKELDSKRMLDELAKKYM